MKTFFDVLTILEQSGSFFNSDINVVLVELQSDSNNEFSKQESDQVRGSNWSENQDSIL